MTLCKQPPNQSITIHTRASSSFILT
jgi:hypothetical protein